MSTFPILYSSELIGSKLCNILYWYIESFVSDVTVNGIKYRCGRSVSLLPMLSILIWDVGGFFSLIAFELN